MIDPPPLKLLIPSIRRWLSVVETNRNNGHIGPDIEPDIIADLQAADRALAEAAGTIAATIRNGR